MKSTKNWSKMLLVGMAALLCALGLVLVGCADGGGNGGGGGGGETVDPLQKWTAVSDSKFESNSYINGIAYGGGKFVAVGGSVKMAHSSDGITWTAVSDSKFDDTVIKRIAYGGDKFVAVGVDGEMAYSGNDGSTWTAVSAAESTFPDDDSDPITSIAYGDGKFVAVHEDGTMAYSTNGSEWVAIPIPDDLFIGTYYSGALNGIVYGGDKFVAVGGAKAAYSTDGINWVEIEDASYTDGGYTSTVSVNGNSVAYGNNQFVIVRDGAVYYSN
jgi:hypothetical protein